MFRNQIGKIGVFFTSIVMFFSLFGGQGFAQDIGTPKFTAHPKTIIDPSYPAAFYYPTDDDVTIYDTVQILNFDPLRDVTLELVGKIENEEGWFSFASTTVDVPAYTIFNPVEVVFSITIPDGVCEDEYEGTLMLNLSDYEGKVTSEFTVTSTIAIDVIFDINSGVPCVGWEVLPGLGVSPSFIPPDTVVAEILEEAPVIVPDEGGGGGGIIIISPITPPPPPEGGEGPGEEGEGPGEEGEGPGEEGEAPGEEEEAPGEEEEAPSEEEPSITVNLKAYPEKRLPATGNWGTRGRVKIYSVGGDELFESLAITTNDAGEASFEVPLQPGDYDVSFKGLSHLTKFLRRISFGSLSPVDLDFTFGGTYKVLAGDVHASKDDFVNALDFAASSVALYTTNEHADLNKDGLVNSLDLSSVAVNVYKEGESKKPVGISEFTQVQ